MKKSESPISLQEFSERYQIKNPQRPGLTYQYTNLSSILLSAVIENIRDIPYEKYCQDYIFWPLEMQASFRQYQRFSCGLIYRYDRELRRFKVSVNDELDRSKKQLPYSRGAYTAFLMPHGGLRTNIKSLSKLMIMLINKGLYKTQQVLSPYTVREIYQNTIPGYKNGSDRVDQGLILYGSDELLPGKYLWGHSGSAYGLLSSFYYNPEEGYGFVVIINGIQNMSTSGAFFKVEKEIIQLLYDRIIESELNRC